MTMTVKRMPMRRLALLATTAVILATTACTVSGGGNNMAAASAGTHDQIGVDVAGMNRSV